MSMDGQGRPTKRRRKLPKISTGRVGCTNVTDRQTTDRGTDGQTIDGRAIAYSERERELSFAKNCVKPTSEPPLQSLMGAHCRKWGDTTQFSALWAHYIQISSYISCASLQRVQNNHIYINQSINTAERLVL